MADPPRSPHLLRASPRLEAALAAVLARARAAWPTFGMDEAAFADHLAQRLGTGEVLTALEALHAEDLYLAFASLAQHPSAQAELDLLVVAASRSAVAQLRAPGMFGEEVQQLLRQKLLLPTGGSPPKLLDYAGRGPLALWLRVAALRVALNLLESERPAQAADPERLGALPAGGPGPESALEQRRFAPELKSALEDALASLSPRERNYLRLYFLEGLTVEAIARMEGANKSTVSSWLTRAKEALLEQVRRLLHERLSLSPSELDGLVGRLQSQIDLSLIRILG